MLMARWLRYKPGTACKQPVIKFKNSIGLRLLRYVFGCYLMVAILVTGVQLVSEYRHVKSGIFEQIYDLEKTFKNSFVNSIWSFDTTQLEVTLFGMTKINTVSGIKIVDEHNQTLASIGDVLAEDSLVLLSKDLENIGMKEIELTQAGSAVSQTLFEYTFPIEYQDNLNSPTTLIGYGHIYTDVTTIIDRVKYSFILIIINSVIKTAALWLFFLYFVNKFIAKPLDALANAASALNPEKLETLNSSKALDDVVAAKHDDELYLLATNFDQMRIAIVDKMKIIESQKRTLEGRVLERTKSLSKANEELRHLALHDTLTSLPNRTLFQDRLAQLLKTGQRGNSRFLVASIDLTKFKAVNDNYGHQIGDLILVEVARRLSGVLRSTDTLARMGGDEFYALFALDSDSDGELIVRKFIKALQDPVVFNDSNVVSILINANVGTAIYPDHGEEADSLVKNADMAMYQAKNAGINYVLYSPEEDSKLRRQLKLSQDFNAAIEDDQLFLLYQPILDIKSNRVTKIEALVRWQHPTLGLISPVEFIPICERNGRIFELTQWVFHQTCKQCKPYCHADKSLSISINLSGRVFGQPEIPDILENICRMSKMPPGNINLEITESTAMAKPDQAIEILNRLTRKGFSVSIDDFGTGYSSFSYLTMLPVNELKIDQSFLLNRGKNSDKVIKAMIDLAHSLNLKVVGEGVETEALLDLLEGMDCDYAQGFYIDRPLPASEIHQLLLNDQSIEAT
ncbi:MAG: diguanylate cyclase (GGDEF)-like protein [Gammaproteobacteria bacterium]